MKRLVLLVLLALNTVMELGGGAMMIARPADFARDTFHVAAGDATNALVALIGGATLSFALLSATALEAVFSRRPNAPLLTALLGGMLLVVGGVMVLEGFRIGALDMAKGAVFLLGGLALRAPEPRLARG